MPNENVNGYDVAGEEIITPVEPDEQDQDGEGDGK